MNLLEQYQVAVVFLLVGAAMVSAPMVLLALLRPRKPSVAKEIPYECGMDPIGDAQVCFDLRFYTDALIFVVFDVEAVLMFPWAKVFRSFKDPSGQLQTGVALAEGLVFVGVLALGLAYVWVKGDIDWVKSIQSDRGVVRVAGVVPSLPPPEIVAPETPPEFEPAAAATPSHGGHATGDASGTGSHH